METLKHALDLISEGYLLASLDIKDAYFYVKIDKKFWKYIKFSDDILVTGRTFVIFQVTL